jgi:hypothetical protein
MMSSALKRLDRVGYSLFDQDDAKMVHDGSKDRSGGIRLTLGRSNKRAESPRGYDSLMRWALGRPCFVHGN